MRNTLRSILAVAATYALLSPYSSAGIIATYSVSNATDNSDEDIGHGLWTANSGFSPNRFSFDPQFSIFQISDDDNDLSTTDDITAILEGTARQTSGAQQYTAFINILLEGFQESTGQGLGYKREGGAADGSWTNSIALAAPGNGDIDFFREISGTITFEDSNGNPVAQTSNILDVDFCNNDDCSYGFQFGDGANAKNSTVFGGSVWIDNPTPNSLRISQNNRDHWDLNLNFTPTDSGDIPNPVPVPSSFLLVVTGCLAFTYRRRKLN